MAPQDNPITYKFIEVGKTLYQTPSAGTPRFPPRAAYFMLRELFRQEEGPTTLYDPFCGNGVLLLTAFLLFPERLQRLLGSDIHPLVVDTAQKNIRWLCDPKALQERLQAIAAYQTQNDQLKSRYQEKCRLMFARGQEVNLGTEIFQQDAKQVGAVLAAIDGSVTVITDPPYSPSASQTADFGPTSAYPEPLEPFLKQLAAAANVTSLTICYPIHQPILPLLEAYFNVSCKRGTKSRGIYYCTRRP